MSFSSAKTICLLIVGNIILIHGTDILQEAFGHFGVDVSGDGNVQKRILKPGHGFDSNPLNTSYVTINYKMFNTNHSMIIEQENNVEIQIGIGNVMCCWDLALTTMLIGEISLIRCDTTYLFKDKYKYQYEPGTSLDFEIEMIEWTEPQKIESISNEYNIITCNEIDGKINKIWQDESIESESFINVKRRLISIDYDLFGEENKETSIDYNKGSFYIICLIIIMNAMFLPYACIQFIGERMDNIITPKV